MTSGVLASGLLVGLCTPTAAMEPKANIPSITVEGQASREVAPDIAVVSFGVSTNRPSAADASADNSRTATALLAAVKAAGIAERDVQTTQATLTPVFETDRNGATSPKIEAFRATNMVQIRVRNLAGVGQVVSRLFESGANALEGIDFTVSDPTPIVDELRAIATRDARHKAEIYADAVGVRLGRVLEIAPEIASSAPEPRFLKSRMAAVASSEPMPVQAGVERLEARVNVTWELMQ